MQQHPTWKNVARSAEPFFDVAETDAPVKCADCGGDIKSGRMVTRNGTQVSIHVLYCRTYRDRQPDFSHLSPHDPGETSH